MVLHHSIVNGAPKIILDAGLAADVKLQFHGLQGHLTLFLLIFSVEIFENQGFFKEFPTGTYSYNFFNSFAVQKMSYKLRQVIL
jgi:hypothetical protein